MAKQVLAATARNVWNHEAMDKEIARVADLATDNKEFETWLKKALRAWLLTNDEHSILTKLTAMEQITLNKKHPWILKSFAKGVALFEFDETDIGWKGIRDQLDYAIAGIAAAKVAKKPLNLKFEEAVAEGKKQELKERSKGPKERETKELLFKISGGAWWNLTNYDALVAESEDMGHCVGWSTMSYKSRVAQGTTQIWSFRDNKNEAHVTVEIRMDLMPDIPGVELRATPTIVQIRGKDNKKAATNYRNQILAMLAFAIQERGVRIIYKPELTLQGITLDEVRVTPDLRAMVNVVGH